MSVLRMDEHRPAPRRGLVVSGHQPDLLPYSGFFYKMANSDVLDLRVSAQVQQRGWQRRVKMRDAWVTLSLVKPWAYRPIQDVAIDNAASRDTLHKAVRLHYAKAPFYAERQEWLHDLIASQHSALLWQFNLGLLLGVRDYLGIDTPLALGVPSVGKQAEGVASYLRAYPGIDTYLSGNGARKYMSDTTPFDQAGIAVEWSRHQAVTGDSIVTVLMDYENPTDIIMKEGE